MWVSTQTERTQDAAFWESPGTNQPEPVASSPSFPTVSTVAATKLVSTKPKVVPLGLTNFKTAFCLHRQVSMPRDDFFP